MDPDPDEEQMEGMILYYKREHHQRMVFEENDGGVDDKKNIIYAKRLYTYMNDKKAPMKGGYYVEVSGSYGKKVI